MAQTQALTDLPSTGELQRLGAELLRLWRASALQDRVRFAYNPRMRTRAGVAWLAEARIELNPHLLARCPNRVRETVAHELAHVVVFERSGRRAAAHGPEWASLMETAGFQPRRLHRMNVRGLRRRRRAFYYLHVCVGCASWWVARRVRRDRPCRACGPGVVRLYRCERTSQGLAQLVALASRVP